MSDPGYQLCSGIHIAGRTYSKDVWWRDPDESEIALRDNSFEAVNGRGDTLIDVSCLGLKHRGSTGAGRM